MNAETLRLRGLRAGNLKELDLDLVRGAWTAVHGPSGAGKSALLFGVLEPVSRRRFAILQDPRTLPGQEESWLQPLADSVEGLEPVIASAGEIPRGRRKASLVAVLDLLGLLRRAWEVERQYACLQCNTLWSPPDVAALEAAAEAWDEEAVVLILSAAGAAESARLVQAGWTRYHHGGQLVRLEEAPDKLPEDAYLMLDRFRWRSGQGPRLRDALATALARGAAIRIVVNQQSADHAAADRCPQCSTVHASHHQGAWTSDLTLEDRVLEGRSWAAWMAAPFDDWLACASIPQHGRAFRRLQLLQRTGLGHLAGHRLLGSLSLGEARRLELVSWIAQVRRGQTVLLDEPGMGLHGRERQAVASLLQELVHQGNTVFTADPAREFLEAAHHWLALGPEGGPGGGLVVGQGARAALPEEDWVEDPTSAAPAKDFLRFRALKERHLAIPYLKVPLGRLVAFCGVSGSGKTTLLEHEILPRLRAEERVQGKIPMGGVHSLLERALRWSPASTIATLAGVWQEVRAAFASSEEARIRGLEAGDLVARDGKGGCPTCRGYGLDQHHLPCATCEGLGLRIDLLDLRLRNRSLRDWLTTPLERLEKRLPAKGRLRNTIRHLIALGLGERTLGERGRFLSLGERGRLALARVLSTARPGFPKLFLLDEPCLGLPVQEARKVVKLLRELCAQGHSFWVVEHHEYLLRAADWMMEIGPGAGRKGGQCIFQGLPAEVLEGDTPTGTWLASRRKETAPPPEPPSRPPLVSRRIEEDEARSGRRFLEQTLERELAMRSPLLYDQVGLGGTGSANTQRNEVTAEDWTPAAWPIDPPRGTGLDAVLGLEAPIRRVLREHGHQACRSCGGAGPWQSFELAAITQNPDDELLFATPLPDAFLNREEHTSWLTAAGFRRFLRDGRSIRWRRDEQEALQAGDLVWLDRLNAGDQEHVGRLRDIAHHGDLLGEGHVLALDPNTMEVLWRFETDACRDCHKRDQGLEARLGSLRTSDLPRAPLGDVLKACAAVDQDPLFPKALELLNHTSLRAHASGDAFHSLTGLERKAARLGGWLLHPLPGVVLLADQPLSGLPPAVAQRFGEAMLQAGTTFHFTDPEAWVAEAAYRLRPQGKPPAAIAALPASLPIHPEPFPMPFRLREFCDPPRARHDVDLRQALDIEQELRSYYLKSEVARLQGWGPQDLDPSRSEMRCSTCRGAGRQWLHPQWALACGACHGSGWSTAIAALEERGVRWMDLPQQSLRDLATLFADHGRLGGTFRAATELGLGDFALQTPLRTLPEGVRMLAPLAATLAAAEERGGSGVESLQIGLGLAGWIPLVAEQISTRIAGFPSAHTGLSWREHHPLHTAS